MHESKKIIIIITTKNYPLSVWEDFKQLEYDLKKLDFDDSQGFSGNYIYIKKLSINSYEVFVVPCLRTGETVTNEDRRHYLDKIIAIICPNINKIVDDVYLVAHDRDFNRSIDGIIVSEKDIPSGETSITSLLEVVKQKHTFIFQHDGSIRQILTRIKDYKYDDNNNPVATSLEEDDCRDIVYKYIEPERTMREFFQKTNLNSEYQYPKL